MVEVIDSFTGNYAFLHNQYILPMRSFVYVKNEDELDEHYHEFPTVEHAFAANKSLDSAVHERIKSVEAFNAKAIGWTCKVPPGWDTNRIEVMTRLIRDKFTDNLSMKMLLLSTGSADLIAKDHGPYWGVDENGNGENNLGRILEKVRYEISEEGTVQDIFNSFLIKNGLDLLRDKIKLEL